MMQYTVSFKRCKDWRKLWLLMMVIVRYWYHGLSTISLQAQYVQICKQGTVMHYCDTKHVPEKGLLLNFVREHMAAFLFKTTWILPTRTTRYGKTLAICFWDWVFAYISDASRNIYSRAKARITPWLRPTRLSTQLTRGVLKELVSCAEVTEKRKQNRNVKSYKQ